LSQFGHQLYYFSDLLVGRGAITIMLDRYEANAGPR